MKLLTKIQKDKLLHFGVSACLGAILKLVMPWYIAFAVTLIIGIIKEVYDKSSGKGTPEWKDLFADFLGAFVGAI